MRRGQRTVAAASIIIAAASIIAYVFYRIHAASAPLWDKVLAAYGLVFCLFLWFDRAAKSVADARTARRSAEPARPRPRPGNSPLQAAVLPEQAAQAQAPVPVEIDRVQPQEDDAFLVRVEAFAAELGALDGTAPAVDENGRTVLANPDRWRNTTGLHPFQIRTGGKVVGACGVHIDASGQTAALDVFYIDPEARRQHLGKAATQRLAAFLRLAGVTELRAELSVNNWRGARFVEACGCQPAKDVMVSDGRTCWALSL